VLGVFGVIENIKLKNLRQEKPMMLGVLNKQYYWLTNLIVF